MPQTKFVGANINHGTPIPATIALKLSNEGEWIVGVVDGKYLKMVKLRVTGASSYEWIDNKYTTKYDPSCLTSFSESCFVGKRPPKKYQIILVAELGKQYKSIFLSMFEEIY